MSAARVIFARAIAAIFAVLLLCFFPSMASAQTVNQYTNTTTGGSGDNLNDLFDDEAASGIASHNANFAMVFNTIVK